MTPGQAALMASITTRKRSRSWVGVPSSQRTWTWMTAAPASKALLASRTISSTVYGTAGFCSLVTSAPQIAAVMMSFSMGNRPPFVGTPLIPPGRTAPAGGAGKGGVK